MLAQRTDYKNVPEVIILYHHIPKVTEIAKDQNNCQTLISRAGTGGGNVPLIMVKDERKKQNDK